MINLRNLRTEFNLTAKKLSEKLNCSQSLVYEWEKGRSEPSISALIKLSKIFNCSIEYLLGVEKDYSIVNISESSLTKNECELLVAFRLLNEMDQQKVIGYCSAKAY